MKRPRLALCLEYGVNVKSGVSVLVKALIEGLHAEYEIVLVSRDAPETLAADPLRPLLLDQLGFDRIYRSNSRREAERLAGLLAERKVELAHLHSGANYGWGNKRAGGSVARALARRGIRSVSTVHSLHSILDHYCDDRRGLAFRLALLPLAWTGKVDALRHLQAEVGACRQDQTDLARWYPTQRRKFGHLYHSLLDPDREPPPPPEAEREKVVLAVGHLAPRKGQLDLVEAFAQIAHRHPEWKLHIAGFALDPDYGAAIAQAIRAARLEERVRLLGPRDDVPDLMRRAAVFVQPSRYEGLGLALQEALFRGCACLGAAVRGIVELIEPGQNGLLFPAGSRLELREALASLLESAELRRRLAAAGRDSILAREMTRPHMLQRHRELYAKALAAPAV